MVDSYSSNLKKLYNNSHNKTIARVIINMLRKIINDSEIVNIFNEEKKNYKLKIKEDIIKKEKEQGFLAPEDYKQFEYDDSDVWNIIYNKIKNKKQNEEEKVKNISANRKKELDNIRQQTQVINKIYNLDEDWMSCFNEYSFFNEVNGINLFYVFLSLITKDINKMHFGNGVRNILHYFFIQNSGSGKDRSFDFVQMQAEKVNTLYKKFHKENLIRVYNASGSESMEAYLDSLDVDYKGKIGDLIPGIFSSCDLLILRECSFLFSGVGTEGRQSKREIFLQVMEGRPVVKSLKSWKGNKTVTYCNACIIGATRPISNMREHMANTGLQQRALNYMRNIDLNLRKKMLKKVSEKSIINKKDEEEREHKFNKLAVKLIDFRNFFKKNKFKFKNQKELTTLISDRIYLLFERIEKELLYSTHKDILHTFMGRFVGLVNIIAIYNAAIRKSTLVEKIDIDRALQHIENNFNSIIEWVGETIHIDKLENNKVKQELDFIKKVFQDKSFIYKSELIKKFMKKFNCSNSTAYRRINNYNDKFEIVNKDNKKGELIKYGK